LIALGKLGLGLFEESREILKEILKENRSHMGAKVHLDFEKIAIH
jgi:hypothetical protein